MTTDMTLHDARQQFNEMTSRYAALSAGLTEKDLFLWASAGLKAGEYTVIEPRIAEWSQQSQSPLMKIGWIRLLGSVRWRQLKLPEAVDCFRDGVAFATTQVWTHDKKPVTSKNYFDPDQGLELLWKTLAKLASEKVKAFAAAGTLLGLEREGGLLPHDKDLDIGVMLDQIGYADTVLKEMGWKRTDLGYRFTNFASYSDPASQMVIDLCGFTEEPKTGKLLGGFWLDGVPWEWQRVLEYPMPVRLESRDSPAGLFWHLADPDSWLTALYGDWRTPDTEFDTTISAYNLRGFSLLTQCYAYSRILQNLLRSNIPRACSLVKQVIRRHLPDDPLLIEAERALRQSSANEPETGSHA